MPAYLTVRPLTAAEAETLERLARGRTAPARAVERAAIVWQAHQGLHVPAIARTVGVCEATVRLWISRFNASGLAGLQDRRRSGRPTTYPPEAVGTVIAASLTDPQELGLPFGSWTLDRLAAYLHEEQGIMMQRSRIGEILQREGLRWRQQETWFGERPDPAFGEKRGPSSRSTRHLLPTASCSAWTRWGQRAPRASPDHAWCAPIPRGSGDRAPGRRSTTAGAGPATSSALSCRPPARR